MIIIWEQRESNPRQRFWRPLLYRLTILLNLVQIHYSTFFIKVNV